MQWISNGPDFGHYEQYKHSNFVYLIKRIQHNTSFLNSIYESLICSNPSIKINFIKAIVMQLSLNTCMQNETSETAFSAINERFLIKQILQDKQCTMKSINN